MNHTKERTAFVARASRDQDSYTAVPFYAERCKSRKQEAIHSGLKLVRVAIGQRLPCLEVVGARAANGSKAASRALVGSICV
jgi:hypothetical protein